MISIAIAAYNGEKYIEEQLQSLFRQTRKADEIVISDDSPGNALWEKVGKIAANAPCPIRIAKNEKTLGPTQNFARAISMTSGDIIFLCDQDDVWLENKVEKLSAELENHPECDVVFCNSKITGPGLEPLGYATEDVVGFTREKAEALNKGEGTLYILKTPMVYGHNIAMRRSFLRIALPIPSLLPSYDLWITELCAGRGRMRCVYEELTLHRRHGGNQSIQDHPSGISGRLGALLQKHRAGKDTELTDSFHHADAAYRRLLSFREECPAESLAMLKSSAGYYRDRLDVTSRSRFLRPFLLPRVRGYFSCGYGWRSILRDLIF